MPRLLTYGLPTDRCGLQVRLGVEKGFFREEGIDLTSAARKLLPSLMREGFLSVSWVHPQG